MKVSDLIEWLKTQDQDADVKIEVEIDTAIGTLVEWEDFDPEKHSESFCFSEKTLYLGAK